MYCDYSPGTHYRCVAYETPPDRTGYSIMNQSYNPPISYYDTFNIPNHTSESGVITNVSFFWRIKDNFASTYGSSGTVTLIDTVNANDNDTVLSFTGSWNTSSTNYATNPATGVAWTWAEVDGMQLKIELLSDADADPKITAYPECNQLYIVVQYAGQVEPEIRTTQCYAKVNSSPADTVCELNMPEEVSTNHSINVKTINMWNGNREVYGLNRSGKSMLLTGKEIDYENGEAVQRIQCVRDMGIVGADIVINDFDLNVFNGTYKIRSFNWIKVSKYPLVFEWVLELEDSEL